MHDIDGYLNARFLAGDSDDLLAHTPVGVEMITQVCAVFQMMTQASFISLGVCECILCGWVPLKEKYLFKKKYC